MQITLAERVTRLHKSAFPSAFFKSTIGEGNAARRSSADATAKAARAALCVRSAAPHHRPRARRRIGEALCAFCCSAPGAVSSVYGSDLARFTPTCACAVSRSRIMKPALRSEKPSQGDWLAPRRKGHSIGRARTDSFSGDACGFARSSRQYHQNNRADRRRPSLKEPTSLSRKQTSANETLNRHTVLSCFGAQTERLPPFRRAQFLI